MPYEAQRRGRGIGYLLLLLLLLLLLTSALSGGRGQLHTRAVLPPGKQPLYPL